MAFDAFLVYRLNFHAWHWSFFSTLLTIATKSFDGLGDLRIRFDLTNYSMVWSVGE